MKHNISAGSSGTPRKRFSANAEGNLSLTLALAAVPLAAIAGMAIDFGRVARVESELQQHIDSAALAAAAATNLSANKVESENQRTIIARNFIVASAAGLSDAKVTGEPVVTIQDNTVEVSLKARVDASFSSLLNVLDASAGLGAGSAGDAQGSAGSGFEITLSSKAKWTPANNYICMLALNATAAPALSVQGTADIKADHCSVQVNSASNQALAQSGNATVKAGAITVSGNYSGGNFTPTPRIGSPAFPDPLAAQFDQDYTLEIAKAVLRYSSKSAMTFTRGSYALQPGLYQGGIRVDNGVTLRLQPGVYFIKDSTLEIRGGGTIEGTGVTLVLTGNQNAILYVIAGGNLNIKAPPSGSFAGLAVAQHPMVLPAAKYSNTVIGGGQLNIEGIIYMPRQNFYVTGNGTGTTTNLSAGAKQFAIVADTITVQGNGQVNIGASPDYSAAGLPALPNQKSGGLKVSLMK